jgi:hypothetical protein
MLACIFFLAAHAAFGQDLSQLPARATKLWELRKQANKLEALQFIDQDTRKTYLQWSEPPILNFKVTGLEFTDDRNKVEVLLRVRSILPQIGEIDLIIREPWIWKDRKWSMQALTSATPFSAPRNGQTGEDRVPPKIEIASNVIDLGRHSQGDVIDGKIAFVGNRNEIRNINALGKLSGLFIATPIWTTPSEGFLSYRWETTVVSSDVDETVPLEVLGVNDSRTSIDIRFQMQIDGKVAFKQTPELIDTAQAGQAELEIHNLSATTPLKILSVLSHNPAFAIGDDIPESIAPGASGTLKIRYSAQTRPTGASIALVLSETLGPAPTIGIPLNVKQPEEEKPPSLTRDDIERIIRQTPKPNIP